MLRNLKTYQQKAFNYVKDRYRIALFMEMRLGKTIVVIRWFKHREAKRILIITPKPTFQSWKEELILEGFKEKDIAILNGTPEQRKALVQQKTKITLANPEAITYLPEIYTDEDWDCVVIDESTRIRNPEAQITKILNKKQIKLIPYKAILTGLPNPESELDFFEQMAFLWDGRYMGFNNFWSWRNAYCFQVGYDWIMTKQGKQKLVEELKKDAFFLSRKEAKIGSEKIYEKRYIDMDAEQKKLYEQIKNDFGYAYKKEEGDTKWIPVKLSWMQQISGGFTPDGALIYDGKAQEILHLLKTELKNEKVVIWCKYTNEIKHLVDFITSRSNLEAIPFLGGDYSREKEFKTGKAQVIVAQPRSGMQGLDWSVASTVIYYSNWWDNEIRRQSEDRVIHPNKKEPILFIDLLTKDSIDEHVLNLLKRKNLNQFNFQKELIKCVS